MAIGPQPPGRAPGAGDTVDGLEVVVSRVLFANPDSGWCAIRAQSSALRTITAVGGLVGVREGDRLRLAGRWVEHPKFGEQLEVSSWVTVTPSTEQGILRFLASGRIKGLGPRTAERLVAAFGLDTLDVLDRDPQRLLEIRGIGPRTLERIRASWQEQRGVQQIVVFLASHGVPAGVAIKLHKRYGGRSLEVVRDNPYRLAEEVYGVGFLTADRIARALGLAEDSPQRYEAGLLHTLDRAAGEGHLFLPEGELEAGARKLLDLGDEVDLRLRIHALEEREKVVRRPRTGAEDAIYGRRLEAAEGGACAELVRLLRGARELAGIDPARAVTWFEGRASLRLAEGQRRALTTALEAGVVIVTGGPGTGKTTLVRGLTEILGRADHSVELAAPTGRAAKRLQEATGRGARTLHRLLEFNPVSGTFARTADSPLACDLVVVDEVSMLDMELAAHLLRGLPTGCRLVLVGDADQLPSVGPGNVLADLIASRAVPTVRLEHIFRQAQQSLIVVNAHRINRGEMPVLDRADGGADFFFVARDDPAAAADLAVEMASVRIPRRFRLDPISDIQVLTPMHRGAMGVSELNRRLQAALTPAGAEVVLGSRRFRAGDKVMQLRNNYDLDIYNGDLGRVTEVDVEERELEVDFDGRRVRLTGEDLEDLTTAFACTIHKAQGSEYPAVVVLLHHHHHIMLQRNLLYTAITRGRRLVTVIGSRRALGRAVSNNTVRRRHTDLAARLRATLDLQP